MSEEQAWRPVPAPTLLHRPVTIDTIGAMGHNGFFQPTRDPNKTLVSHMALQSAP